nr:unnamed protein product [Callosobruchus analis]
MYTMKISMQAISSFKLEVCDALVEAHRDYINHLLA